MSYILKRWNLVVFLLLQEKSLRQVYRQGELTNWASLSHLWDFIFNLWADIFLLSYNDFSSNLFSGQPSDITENMCH